MYVIVKILMYIYMYVVGEMYCLVVSVQEDVLFLEDMQ